MPVLLWILAFMAVMTEIDAGADGLPRRQPSAHMIFGAVAITNRGFYIPWPVFEPGSNIVVGTFIVLADRRS